MVTNINYTFSVSISTESYLNKEISGAMIGSTKDENNRIIRKNYGYNANKGIGYSECTVTSNELLDKLTNGYVFCHLFNPTTVRKDGTFGSSQKKDDNFNGSFCIGVDIDDTNYSSIESYINTLELKPTLWYSSYSNSDTKVKFRMIYVFDEKIEGKYYFRYCAYQLNQKLQYDTNEVITDDCNLRCSQYFNGTNKNNNDLKVEYGITNNIYSLNDFNITNEGYINFLKNDCYYKSKNKNRNKDINNILNQLSSIISISSTTYYNDLQKCATPQIEENEAIKSENSIEVETTKINPSLLNDMSRLDYDEFMKYNRHKYNYYYRYDNYNWIECDGYKWAYIDENYFSLYWNVNTVKDGSKRRKKVFERMCLRRVINPNVDADTIAFNAYEDIHRFFDNSDNILNSDYIERNVIRCFELSIDDIKEMYSENIEYLKSKKPAKGKIYKFYSADISYRNTAIKEINKQEILGYYNTDISIKDNIKYLKNWGISVSEKTLYTYLSEIGMSNKEAINKEKINKEEYIKSLINNENCSVRKFRELLNQLNIKLSDKKLREYIKEYKEGLEESEQSTTYYNDLQKTATPIFSENEVINYDFSSDTTYSNDLDYTKLENEGLSLFNQYYTNYNNYYY